MFEIAPVCVCCSITENNSILQQKKEYRIFCLDICKLMIMRMYNNHCRENGKSSMIKWSLYVTKPLAFDFYITIFLCTNYCTFLSDRRNVHWDKSKSTQMQQNLLSLCWKSFLYNTRGQSLCPQVKSTKYHTRIERTFRWAWKHSSLYGLSHSY